MEFISLDKINKIFDNLSEIRFGIIGDFCLDAYLFIDSSRSEISLETSLTTIPVRQEKYYPGGAGNVARNLIAMGALHVKTFGVVGKDQHGWELLRLLREIGVDVTSIREQKDSWSTNTYTKIYEQGKEQRRIDFGNFNVLDKTIEDKLLGEIEKNILELDVLIINQQLRYGIYTKSFRKALLKILSFLKSHSGKIILVDSRDYSNEFDGTIRKLNEHEGARLCEVKDISFSRAREIADILYKRWNRPLFLTRGQNGLIVRDKNGLHVIPGLQFFSPIDSVGAGDSLLAGMAAALASGVSMVEAAAFGNLVAGVTVTKLYETGTATKDEVIELYENAMYRYRPELAASTRKARYYSGSEIEIVTDIPKKIFDELKIEHAIFDHDGTISTLRQGWEEVMELVMIRSILGDYYERIEEVELAKITERVRDFIDKTTGVQTLFQMEGLVNLIKEFGYVPADKIMDAKYYKKVFNDELSGKVKNRLYKFDREELHISDLTIKSSVLFLEYLYEKGISLYLASGTDQDDVEKDASALGYSRLFNGHIYGAIGNLNHEPKRHVVMRILEDIDNSESRKQPEFRRCSLVVFGDGPVEIREGHRHGCLTVGVASNEIRRYGLDKKKRTRLIEAGADIIIPDFSQFNRLSQLLFQ